MISIYNPLIALAAILLYSAVLILFPVALLWFSHKHRELAIFLIESTIFSLFLIPFFTFVPEFIDAMSEVCLLPICCGAGMLMLVVTQRRKSAILRLYKAGIDGKVFCLFGRVWQ